MCLQLPEGVLHMEVSRVEVRPGVWLTHLREDKFKTACFSVSLLSQLSRDTAAMNALIPFVLRRGTRLYPDMEALNARFEELYGTAIEPSVRRIGAGPPETVYEQKRKVFFSLRHPRRFAEMSSDRPGCPARLQYGLLRVRHGCLRFFPPE